MLRDQHVFADAWLAAWNSHDLERVLAHYSDDIVFMSPFVAKLAGDAQGMLQGKAALRDYFARGLAAYPNLHFRLRRVLAGVDSVVLVYDSVNDLLAAEFMQRGAGGQVVRAVAHYTSRG